MSLVARTLYYVILPDETVERLETRQAEELIRTLKADGVPESWKDARGALRITGVTVLLQHRKYRAVIRSNTIQILNGELAPHEIPSRTCDALARILGSGTQIDATERTDLIEFLREERGPLPILVEEKMRIPIAPRRSSGWSLREIHDLAKRGALGQPVWDLYQRGRTLEAITDRGRRREGSL